jgi:phosphatidylserine/phosphatidylglycerophosphate/cardiolipin synthase-like enzyme
MARLMENLFLFLLMKIKNQLACGLLIGITLGVLITYALIASADMRNCPEKNCAKDSEIIPVSDRGYFPAVHEALQNAKSSIHIASFELKYYDKYPSSLQNQIIEDLIAAHKRGVDVKIVLDEYADSDPNNNGYEYVKRSGVEIKYDSNKTTTHSKLIVIDGKIVVLGSTNFSFYALEKNNEVDVILFSEKTAAYFERYFQRLWDES